MAKRYEPLDIEGEPVADPDEIAWFGKFDSKFEMGQVTVRCPVFNEGIPFWLGLVNCTAIAYGFLPWIIPAAFVLWWLLSMAFRLKGGFFPMYGFMISMACAILNELILKPILKQPRPKQSICYPHKPGMPSGHVLNAFSIMVWAGLELYFHYTVDKVAWFVIILICKFPVPWARWHNYDHTAAQAGVSIVIGTGIGAAAWYIRSTYFPGHIFPWDLFPIS